MCARVCVCVRVVIVILYNGFKMRRGHVGSTKATVHVVCDIS